MEDYDYLFKIIIIGDSSTYYQIVYRCGEVFPYDQIHYPSVQGQSLWPYHWGRVWQQVTRDTTEEGQIVDMGHGWQ